jgi:protein involved in polysaccharide export with SLBB domain
MKKIVSVAFLLTTFFHSITLKGQDILSSKDLSTIRVDNLSDNDILKIKTQLEFNNVSINQAEPMALAKGMNAKEFEKLKERLGTTPTMNNNTTAKQELPRTQEVIENKKIKDPTSIQIFGSELFDNPILNFEPNLKLATPLNYILGPGDELQVSIYGNQEFNYTIPVNAEGKIKIDHVGEISVAGLSFEAATQKIKGSIGKIYTSVRTGQSKMGLSLSRIRTIKVTIIGSKQPGNYSVSSLATVFNLLYLAGGPGTNGSYRNIELIRDNKTIAHIDIYKFLADGNQSDNVGLKDNDVIRIPTYSKRVVIKGQVKRPGIFELKAGEKFSTLLSFASGFSDAAYTASINVIQKTNKEFKIKDLNATEFSSYLPMSGDEFKVTEILQRFENRVQIIGAVFRPDTYSLNENMRIADLILKAEGLKEDAYQKRAVIVRLKADLTTEIVNVNLLDALSGNNAANILLKREDQITVYSILDFKEEFTVSINGEIKKPGSYKFRDKLTLNDLLVEAGGLLSSASKKVEIARMLKSEDIDDKNPKKTQLFNLDINTSNNEQIINFEMEPFDVINIRKMAVYEKPQMVTLSGSVVYPGVYVLADKKETIFDIINRAGGLTSVGDLNGVKIKRPILATQIEAIEDINLNLGQKDSSQLNLTKKLKENLKYAVIPIEWSKILKDPGNYSNITLLAGDEIEVAKMNENVKITGNVLLTSEIPFIEGKGLNYYIGAVGGVDNKGWKKRAYIIYPNGKAAVTSNFLFFNFFPSVTAGSQIVIPERPTTNKVTAGEITSIASVLVGMAGVVIAILRR